MFFHRFRQRADSSLTVKRDETVQVEASTGSSSKIKLFIRKHFVKCTRREQMYEPWGREQVLSPAFSFRELLQ